MISEKVKNILHRRLQLKKQEIKVNTNCLLIDDPTELFNCSLPAHYDIFEEIAKYDKSLVYMELMNSCPVKRDGYTPIDKSIAHYSFASSMLFKKQCVDKMKEIVLGKKVYGPIDHPTFLRGDIRESWVIHRTINGLQVSILCAFVWVKKSWANSLNKLSDGGFSRCFANPCFMSTEKTITTCSICGRKCYNEENFCKHLERKHNLAAYWDFDAFQSLIIDITYNEPFKYTEEL